MSAVWQRIERELAGRKASQGREVAWLAEQLGCRVQVVANWKERGVPPKRHADIARVLGWSVGALLGSEATPAQDQWPFELVTRQQWEALTERQRGAVEAAVIRALLALHAPVHSPTPTSPAPTSRPADQPTSRPADQPTSRPAIRESPAWIEAVAAWEHWQDEHRAGRAPPQPDADDHH